MSDNPTISWQPDPRMPLDTQFTDADTGKVLGVLTWDGREAQLPAEWFAGRRTLHVTMRHRYAGERVSYLLEEMIVEYQP